MKHGSVARDGVEVPRVVAGSSPSASPWGKGPDASAPTEMVSVVIPVYNGAADLGRCLDALEGQTYPADLVEVVVVDNGSSEDIAAVVAGRPRRFRLVSEGQKGSYAARNRGIRASQGTVLALIDADCLPKADWIAFGVARLLSGPSDTVVGGGVAIFTRAGVRPSPSELFETCFAFPMRRYVEERGFAGTGNLFTLRATWDKVGPFRADLRSGGDWEWGQRCKAAGCHVVFEDRITVGHPARRNLAELKSKRARTFRGGSMLGLAPALQASWPIFLYWWVRKVLPPVGLAATLLRRHRHLGPVALAKVFAVGYALEIFVAREGLRIRRGRAGDVPR